MKLLNTEIETGTNNYNTASYIRKQLNQAEGANWKLKEVKQALAELGLVATASQKRVVEQSTNKEVRVSNLYNIQLVGMDAQYTAINHQAKIAGHEQTLTTYEGYIYDIKFLQMKNVNNSIAVYLMNEDGEKVTFANGINRYWFNKVVQNDYFRDCAKKGLPVLGLHLQVVVRISHNYASVEKSYILEWDSTSEHIAQYYTQRDNTPALVA
jgi:hypothetical protein